MSERMSNAPVYYALAQAHFNPVAAMAKYVNQIQDRLRREGYPLFEPQEVTHLVVPRPGQAQQPEPKIQQTTSWLLANQDRTAGFVLLPSSITFQTTNYDTHETFIPELLRGLSAVHEEVSLDHVGRLGLRYLDAVLPRSGEQVEQYFADGVHGVKFDAPCQHAMSESVFSTKVGPLVTSGTLVVRVYRANAPLGFPPDLSQNGLTPNARFAMTEPCDHGVLDTDHFCSGRMPINPDELEAQLHSLHASVKSVFMKATTDHARETWA
ncbi:TIGR04255 family protein [Marichromatium purpuratum]|uniref:TIGR04255 family protein n=1 Tax=Marichromatium purpuratum TaxID=37487 RepID=UPI001E53B448|nr:TIGR04255 family protein [Marichromatium purpuratum]